MDRHRLAEERSVAYHRVIASRLRRDPAVLDAARQRVREWLAAPRPSWFAHEWSQVLAQPIETIAAFLVERSERAAELRQSSPFAGVLSARERWQIWRDHERRSEPA